MTQREAILELATDGAWTARQCAARTAAWGCRALDAFTVHTLEYLRPTAYARHPVPIEVVTLNGRGMDVAESSNVHSQVIRAGEHEHALGLAELRWRCGIPYDRYMSQAEIGREHRRASARGHDGFGERLPDGAFVLADGIVLCEYDHGRYTARQIRSKMNAFSQLPVLHGQPVGGTVWGAPTAQRAEWLRSTGVANAIVMDPTTWLT